MLGRNILRLVQRNIQPKFNVPRRTWTQVGMVISTPPRVRVSYGEKLLHILFLYVVWITPVFYFLTQIKVWRREYITEQS